MTQISSAPDLVTKRGRVDFHLRAIGPLDREIDTAPIRTRLPQILNALQPYTRPTPLYSLMTRRFAKERARAGTVRVGPAGTGAPLCSRSGSAIPRRRRRAA